MFFKSNKDNNEYLVINHYLVTDLFNSKEKLVIPEEVYQEVRDIYEYDSFNCNIKKDSLLGQFLISHSNATDIINDDFYISYNKVINALNIALFRDDYKMTNKIMPLFKDQIYGTKEDLQLLYPENVLDYILENDDFSTYLEKENDTYKEQPCVVYENGKFTTKLLNNSRQKVKKKDNTY